MQPIFDDIYSFAKNYWPLKRGLIAAICFGSFTILASLPFQISINLVFVGLYISTVTVLWSYAQQRVAKNKIGIGFALTYEENDSCKKIYSDFIQALRNSFANHELQRNLKFVEFPPIRSGRILNYEDAIALCNDANLKFLIFGKIRLRNVEEIENSIFDIKCVAKHAVIPQEKSHSFGQILQNALPNRMSFATKEQFILTEIAAKHIEAVCKYAIGMTYCFSRDYESGEKYLIEAQQEIKKSEPHTVSPNKFSLYECINAQLSHMYESLILIYQQQWRNNNDDQAFEKSSSLIGKLKLLQPNNNTALIASAIQTFLNDRNIAKVYDELNKCKDKNNEAWLCNIAFLKGYEGNLDEAYRNYINAFKKPVLDATILAQCEEFMIEILEQEPHKGELHFCLGVINYKAKQDYASAVTDFQNFLNHDISEKYPRQVSIVKDWLADAERKVA